MLALLIATQLVAAPLPPPVRLQARTAVSRDLLSTVPEACRLGVTQAAGPQTGWEPKLRRLGDLPKAHLEIAINRTVGGCPSPVIVRYDVEGDGRAARGSGD